MTHTIFFGQKNSCCNSKSTPQLDSSELSATSSTEERGCCSISSSLREELIREKAYFLWEEAGRPESDGVEFWIEAEKQVAAV